MQEIANPRLPEAQFEQRIPWLKPIWFRGAALVKGKELEGFDEAGDLSHSARKGEETVTCTKLRLFIQESAAQELDDRDKRWVQHPFAETTSLALWNLFE